MRGGRLPLLLATALAGFLLAAGSAAAKPTFEYEVSRAGSTSSDFDHFHHTVDAVLTDPRGWSLFGAVELDHVSRGGEFDVQLTDPSIIGSYSGCSSYYSCRVGRLVMINDARWRYGTRSYANQLRHVYRQMVVNHEVGHALGFGHGSCGRAGWRAPVMQQQSKSLGDCVANPWPLPSERASLGRRLGVTVGSPPPGIAVGDRIGSIDLGATRDAVLGRLGSPRDERRSGGSDLLTFELETLTVTLTDDRVTAVSTRSDDFRTSGRLGVGSTRTAIREGIPSARCGSSTCVVRAGDIVTSFSLEKSEVTKVKIERRAS